MSVTREYFLEIFLDQFQIIYQWAIKAEIQVIYEAARVNNFWTLNPTRGGEKPRAGVKTLQRPNTVFLL